MTARRRPLPPRDARGRFTRLAPPAPAPPEEDEQSRPLSLVVAAGVTACLLLTGLVRISAPALAAAPGEAAAVAAPPTPAGPAPVPAPPPSFTPELPRGKGMWLHRLGQAAGGDPAAIVAHARAVGLTHLYLRLGSSKTGFYGQGDLDRLLPVAHEAGLRVVGWDFPYLFDPRADAERASAEIAYTSPTGHRIDAFSADIETPAEGVNLSPAGVDAYGARLREVVGAEYPLVATVPRPGNGFPFAEAARHFDALAPMVYWMNRDPVADVTRAIDALAPLGKPVLPIGQAYDGGPEGGPPGPPPKDHLVRFMTAAVAKGAPALSFWVWHHATPDHWAAIAEGPPPA